MIYLYNLFYVFKYYIINILYIMYYNVNSPKQIV